jgi:hypothetical protein
MLLRIGLERGAVAKWIRRMEPAVAVREQRLLCKWLMQHGAVYFESQAEQERFWQDLRSVGSGRSQIPSVWFESWKALRDSRWRVGPHDVDVRLASPASRRRARDGERPERSRIDLFDRSESYQSLSDLTVSGCARAQTARDAVWETWLAPLAAHFDDVTVYDQFLGRQFRDGGERARTNGVAACMWLVGHLSGLPAPHSLTILTLAQSSNEGDVRKMCEAAASMLAAVPERGRLVQITFAVAARYGPKGTAALAKERRLDVHDRHIRFSGGSSTEGAIVIAAGLDRLGPDPLETDVHLQYRPEFKGATTVSIQELRDVEQVVLDASPKDRVDI